MDKLVHHIKAFFERQAFGVCAWWGNILGINSGKIRLFFIYTSFLTVGSPIIIYLIMAFIMQHKRYFLPSKPRKRSVWDI